MEAWFRPIGAGLAPAFHHPLLQPLHLRVVTDHVPQRPSHQVLLLAPGELVTPARVGVGEEEPVPGPQRLELPPDEAAEGRPHLARLHSLQQTPGEDLQLGVPLARPV